MQIRFVNVNYNSLIGLTFHMSLFIFTFVSQLNPLFQLTVSAMDTHFFLFI